MLSHSEGIAHVGLHRLADLGYLHRPIKNDTDRFSKIKTINEV